MTVLCRISVSALAFSSLFFLSFNAPTSISAQEQERGTVKADSLQVYSGMSADSDNVATLTRGTAVLIRLSVTNDEGSWCVISGAGASEKLGFVRCDGLDRPNAPNRAVIPGGTVLFTAPFPSQTPSPVQRSWAIAATAILATFNHEPLGTLSAGGDRQRQKQLLRDWWGISDRDDLLDALAWIDQGGHRKFFSELGAGVSKTSPEALKNVVSGLGSDEANSLRVAQQYYEKFGTQSITGWDYGRYISLCRWGVTVGYLSEDEAWPRVMHAAGILQRTFASWSEFGENYLVGREFWSLRQTRKDGAAMRAVYQRLLNDPGSPWNRLSWNLPLQ